MSGSKIPNEPPPSYDEVAGGSSSARPSGNDSSHLNVPGSATSESGVGIPAAHRRSMEDEGRPLPKGWVRQYDHESNHQFFVDTTKEPPRSTWVHPYDDDEYLKTLSSEERERIEQESFGRGHRMSKEDIIALHTDDEDDDHPASSSNHYPEGELPPRPDGKGKGKDRSFGTKMKDKLTGTTKEQREQERARRAEQERKLYEQHLRIRKAMAEAQRTGQPVCIGKDKGGKDIYIEPPAYQGNYYGGGYGYSPYARNGIYDTPNARYVRPQAPYGRPMGYGYGGGYGMPLALGGGLMGGMMLGGMMGGMGGGF